LHSSVVGTSATAPCRLCGPAHAGPVRPSRVGHAIGPGRLVWPEPVAPLASSQYSASVRGGLPTLLLSPLAGVGHCPLAIGHGLSAGLLVGVLDRGPVSPLSSPRACSGAGPGWHGCGWIAVSVVLSEGPAPWRWAPLVRCPLGRHRGGGSPAARGCAGHWDTGLGATSQLVRAALRRCVWSAAGSPYRAFGRSGRVDRKVELGAAQGGHGPVTPINGYQPAIGQLTRGRCCRSRAHGQLPIIDSDTVGPGADWHRTWRPALAGREHGATNVTV
jgi:hypothetical protein